MHVPMPGYVPGRGVRILHPVPARAAAGGPSYVFMYEVLPNPDDVCKMARAAFEDAIADPDNASEDSY